MQSYKFSYLLLLSAFSFNFGRSQRAAGILREFGVVAVYIMHYQRYGIMGSIALELIR